MRKYKWADGRERGQPLNKPNRSGAYGYKWQKRSQLYLKRNPLCVRCKSLDRATSATEVDHVRPHKGVLSEELFWNEDNWQALCKSCHSKKTNREPNAGERVVVTGLPHSGKTTLVERYAARGDLVFDYDVILAALVVGLSDKRNNPPDLIDLGEYMRNAFVTFVRTSATSRSVFVISSNKRSAAALAAKLGASLLDLG